MTLKLLLSLFFFTTIGEDTIRLDWGKSGHQTMAQLAEDQLTKKAKKAIEILLKGESLAEVSTYADEIKSNPLYRSYTRSHYVNLNKGQHYEFSSNNPKGDVVHAIVNCIDEIKNETNSIEKRAFYLKLLIHFVGDVHQPLHVGNSADKGGNTIRLKWFGRSTNLHRVWDTDMLAYNYIDTSTFIEQLPRLSKAQKRKIKKSDLLEWVEESHQLAQIIYTNVEGKKNLDEPYYNQHFPLVQMQILKGGIRLGTLLNQLFA